MQFFPPKPQTPAYTALGTTPAGKPSCSLGGSVFRKTDSLASTAAVSGTDSISLGAGHLSFCRSRGSSSDDDEGSTRASPQRFSEGGSVGVHPDGRSPPHAQRAEKAASDDNDEAEDSASFGSDSEEDEAKLLPREVEEPPAPAQMRRRSGIQSTEQEMFLGLKARFDAMEQLDMAPARGCDDPLCAQDELAYVRLLKPAEFVTFLRAHDVPVHLYGQGKARSLRDLWAEVIIRECNLQRIHGMSGKLILNRHVRILMLEIGAMIAGSERFLLVKQEASDQGHTRDNLNARVTKKMFDDEDIPSAVSRCLLQVLDLPTSAADKHFDVVSAEDLEEVKASTAYPGLTTVYKIHAVRVAVRDPSSPDLAAIGLPEGRDFTAHIKGGAVGVGKSRTWVWCSRNVLEAANKANKGRELSPRRIRRGGTFSELGQP